MRYATIIALAGLAGCAYGGPGPAERGPTHDGGSFASDAGEPLAHGDAGGGRDASTSHPTSDAGPHVGDAATAAAVDAGTTAEVDAGTTTVVDAGTTTVDDAGTTFETDAGTPAIDAGSGGPGETCATALDVSPGGTWSIDTCASRDDVAASCGHPGTPDVIIQGIAPRSGSTYQIHVGPDWVVQQLTGTGCAPMPFSCGASDWGVSGATFDPYWLWAVERADGSCGMLSLTVDRVM